MLVRTPAGYRLAVDPRDVDAVRFERRAADARRLSATDPAGAVAAAEEALGCWRGARALEDAGDREFAVVARARWDALRLTCAEDRLAALLRLGRAAEVLPEAEELVGRHPLRERPWALLVEALHRCGRTADALARYQQVRRVLDDDLGVAPGPLLQEAHARVLRAPAEPPPAAPPTPPAALSAAGLVGRETESAALLQLLSGLSAGPRFALVEGEPGIGKTRLVHEVGAASGVTVAVGRCHEDDDLPALWPWRQVLQQLGVADVPASDAPFAAFEHVLDALVTVSRRGPVAVVLDDLHWADPASLRLLAFLAVELQLGPVAVLATCRADARDPAGLRRVRETLARTAGFLSLQLRPLTAEATGRLVGSVLGDQQLDGEELARLVGRAGGNPFFATELARLVGDQRSAGLPPGVRDVVSRRLDRLPAGSRPLLQLVAVAGARVPLPLLARAADAPADALADALDPALTAGLLHEDDGRLSFAHALVRETLLAETPVLRRGRLHATVAAALPPDGDPFGRAHHLTSGRPFTDAAETVAACRLAADRAARELAYETAARWEERALAVLTEEPGAAPGVDGAQLLLRIGTMRSHAGMWESAHAVLAETIEVALERGDPATAAAAADQLSRSGGVWNWVPYGSWPAQLVGRLEETVAALAGPDDPARVLVLGALATACTYGPDRDRGRRESAEALAIARRSGSRELLVAALSARVTALWLPGAEREQVAVADELVALTEGPDPSPAAVLALARRAVARLTLGDVEGADADLARAWELAERSRLPLLQAQLASLQAGRALLDGALDVALELIDRAFVLTQRTQLYLQEWSDLLMRCFVWIEQGTLPEHLATLPPDDASRDGSAILQAVALLQAGRAEEAAAVMAAGHGFSAVPPQWDALSLTCWQAHVAAELARAGALADLSLAGEIADRLLPFADLLAVHGGIGALGPVGCFLGRVEAVAGRDADAERHLRSAVAVAGRWRLRPSLARAQLALAELLAGQGRDAEAANLAQAALAVARQVGLRLVASRAERLTPGAAPQAAGAGR